MPNWVMNKLVITGDEEQLNKLRSQVSQPYTTHHWDWQTDTITHGTSEGVFQLWNIVRPTNLEAYYEYDKNAERAKQRADKIAEMASMPPQETLSDEEMAQQLRETIAENLKTFNPQDFIEKFHREVEVGQDWYNWNIREWGTKWEIDEAKLTQVSGQLSYEFSTAWSPPAEALDKLAAQYPSLTFTLRCLDENHCFAIEFHWISGFREYEGDIDINHGVLVEMYGECYACDDHNYDQDLDDDHKAFRAQMKCDEFGQVIDINSLLDH